MNTIPEINEMIEKSKAMQQAKVLACKHREITFENGQGDLICGECDRPLRFLSDAQIEEERLTRVEIQTQFDGPSSCKVWSGENLVFDGVSRDALFQRPVDAASRLEQTASAHAYGVEVLVNAGRPSAYWRLEMDEGTCDTEDGADDVRERLLDEGYRPDHLRIVALTVVAGGAW